MLLSADDCNTLGGFFSGLARSIVIYESNNRASLTDDQFSSLEHLRKVTLDYSDHLLLAAVQQALRDLDAPLAQISEATARMNEALTTLRDIGKAIAIATAGVQLGAAIMSGQLPAIARAVGSAFQAVGPIPGAPSDLA